MEPGDTLVCDVCGLEHRKVPLGPGRKAVCSRCDTLLATGSKFGPDAPLCFAIAGFAFAIPALTLPFIGAEKLGDSRTSFLLTGVVTLWHQRMYALSVIVLVCGAVFPVALLAELILVHLPERYHFTFAGREALRRYEDILRQWSIPEVQVLATLVALAKLGDLVNVEIGGAFWSYCAMTLCLLIANYGFDYSVAAPVSTPPQPLRAPSEWRHRLRFRSRQTSMALALGAALLLYPANFLPVAETTTAGNTRIDTIYSAAMGLGDKGLWVLTLIVLLASIVIPVLKLAGLSTLMYATRDGRTPANPRRMTKLYGALAFIGRWSMLDVFLAGLLAGLVRFGEVALARPMPAIAAFCAVVILTVLATEAFDPHQLWHSSRIPKDP